MTRAAPDDLVLVGHVAGAHGVRGALKVFAYSAGAETLLSVKKWWLETHEGVREATVLSCKRAGDALVATIEGLSDRDIALAMKGTRIHIPRKRFKKPAKDEFYYVDLIGMAVVNREGVALGNVSNIMETGAHAVLVVTDATGGEKPAERLIPFVSHYVDKVDTLAKWITCDWDPSY